MRKLDKNIVAAIILGVSLVLSSFIYAYSNRYEIIKFSTGGILRADKWNGTIIKVELKKVIIQ